MTRTKRQAAVREKVPRRTMNPHALFTDAALAAARKEHGAELILWLPAAICSALIGGRHSLSEPIDVLHGDVKYYGRDFTVIPDPCLHPEHGVAMVKSQRTKSKTPFGYARFYHEVPHGTFVPEQTGDIQQTGIETVRKMKAACDAHQGVSLSWAELASIILHLKP